MEHMKNLLVHINPSKRFNKEHSIMAKIQIDNNYRMGWKKEDVILVTNFPYEYNGIKATEIDVEFCEFRPRSMKTLSVGYMLEKGMIGYDTYWVHDFDAYQDAPIDMDLEDKDLAMTTYGWHKQWSLGSYFFNNQATDIFKWIRDGIYETKLEDEKALVQLTESNLYDINKRYKVINETYNFGMRYIKKVYPKAEKPLKVVHFHLWGKDMPSKDMFLNGKNEIGIQLVSPELKKLFHYHGIK
jgi:hypothetical protein